MYTYGNRTLDLGISTVSIMTHLTVVPLGHMWVGSIWDQVPTDVFPGRVT